MFNSWFIIANPSSGKESFSKTWREILKLLTEYKFSYDFAFTKYSKNEIELVQNAIKNGYRNIISVGGDGTLHHVVNGIMMQRYVKTSDITVGVIPIGTGNDWIKTHNIPKDLRKSIEIIHQKKTFLQDIGVIKSKKYTVYFNNVAGIGYDAFVVKKLQKLKKLGALSYLIAGLLGMFSYRKSSFVISFNDQKIKTNCLMTVFGICRYSGGGMQFTKNVNPNNGLLNISVVSDFSILDLILNLPKLYNGKIVNHKKVQTFTSKTVTVYTNDQTILCQADGELLGSGNVEVSIISNALCFLK